MLKSIRFIIVVFLMTSCSPEQRRDQDNDSELCQAQFQILQKDAYREEGGRKLLFLPVHTSTSLTVKCPNQGIFSKTKGNHGAIPGQKDINGNSLLDITYSYDILLTRKNALALSDAYERLSCEQTNTFLSVDRASDEVKAVLYSDQFKNDVISSLEQDLQKLGKARVGSALRRGFEGGDYVKALEQGQEELKDPIAWATVLTKAWTATVEKYLRMKAEDYHVCNNDALVSYKVWMEFAAGKGHTERTQEWFNKACRIGPILFFNPDTHQDI